MRFFLFAFFIALPTWATTIKVGPNQLIKLPSQAAQLARDGDVVEIDAGDYLGDAAFWQANNLTLRGVGGMAHLHSAGVTEKGKGIWVLKGNNTLVENIGFYDARVKDRNGAGIRLDGRTLTVRRCLFRDNENGILTGAKEGSEVLVEDSEFDNNGHGDGYSHNLYIGAIDKFTLRNSKSRRARIGHQLKSRARINIIHHNTFMDGDSGQSSYLIDLPSGGIATVTDNLLHKGSESPNQTMLAYAMEKKIHTQNELTIAHNTFVNDRRGPCKAVSVKVVNDTALIENNQFYGCGALLGPIQETGNRYHPRNAYKPK